MNRRLLIGAVLAGALGGAGCGDTSTDPGAVRIFNRPTDLAFGCYGKLRLLGDNGAPDPTDPVVFSAQPLSSCRYRHDHKQTDTEGEPPVIVGNGPPGQRDEGDNNLTNSMLWMPIALQPTSGTIIAMTQSELGADHIVNAGGFSIRDGDDLTPGVNPIAVGALPVAIATDTTGCYAVTANAGSCDLSVIDLTLLGNPANREPLVSALEVTSIDDTNVTGPLLARPSAMVSVDLQSPIGVACPAAPTGVYYVAYPDCHAVAAIKGDTGAVIASIKFALDGTPTIDNTGVLDCPAQCGDGDAITDGARPFTLDIVRDTRGDFQRMAIGLDNRPVLVTVDLDLDGTPLSTRTIELEGDIGVTDVAISQQIKMGGVRGGNNDLSGEKLPEAEFVYAVATDATIRVAEVLAAGEECDTQIDPRYLYDERDPSRLVCFPVGLPGNPPRRATARSPGIEISKISNPVSVTISSANIETKNPMGEITDTPHPLFLAGHFAFVAMSNGFTVIVNIDDDNIGDTHLDGGPLTTAVTEVLPHTVRDAIDLRGSNEIETGVRTCNPTPPLDSDGFPIGGPRAESAPTRGFALDEIAKLRAHVLPYTHATLCEGDPEDNPSRAVDDLTYGALVAARERSFPDWLVLPPEETWYVVWEGALSRDGNDLVVDGPVVRSGLVDIAGGGIRLLDQGRPFCAAGIEPFDIVTLRGCDAARGDLECGTGETCYVHPQSKIGTGACLPTDKINELSGHCRDFLVSRRRFSVFEPFAGELRLHERWRDLRTTPVTGCTSDTQCMDLANYEASLSSLVEPKDVGTAANPIVQPYTFACQADPTRAPGPNRCVMTCSNDNQCEAGTLCRGGHCIEGIVPPPECAAGLQRYDLRGSDTFVVVGDVTGYLHPIIEDPTTHRCVEDATASPLLRGRFGLTAPPCQDGDPDDIAINPCMETVEQTETFAAPVFTPPAVGAPPTFTGTCTYGTNTVPDIADATLALRTRVTEAIRFNNPALRLTMVDPTYPGDGKCYQDRQGGLVGVPSVFLGFNLVFTVTAGFNTAVMGPQMVQPSSVVRGPDDTIWVVNAAGDVDDTNPQTFNLFGQLVRVPLFSPTTNDFVFQ